MKKIVLICFVIFSFSFTNAQENLNDYKYVIVPSAYEFLKEADQYSLNSLSKFLFEKYNFNAFLDYETLPEDYVKDNCLGLKANVLKLPGLFKTKLTVQLKNCKNEIVFTSVEGQSRDKKYKVAYHEALRAAFKSFKTVNYKYENNTKAPLADINKTVNNDSQQKIEALQAEIKALKDNKTEAKKAKPPKVNSSPNKVKYNLFAQETSNGFHLLDKTPKIVYTILNSGKKELFIVKDRDAVIYKLNGSWVLAEVIGDDIKITGLNIKF